jgi:hypothetical protein
MVPRNGRGYDESVVSAKGIPSSLCPHSTCRSTRFTGTGSGNVVSHVSVQPAVLNFGNKGPDFVDSVQALTVTNISGNTSLTIHGITLSGSPNAVGAFPL